MQRKGGGRFPRQTLLPGAFPLPGMATPANSMVCGVVVTGISSPGYSAAMRLRACSLTNLSLIPISRAHARMSFRGRVVELALPPIFT